MGEYIKKKKDMNFQSVDSLQSVVNVVNEAAVSDGTLWEVHTAL